MLRSIYPLLAFTVAVGSLNARLYNFNPEQSFIEIFVPKAGLLSFAGHEHYIRTENFSGTLNWNSEKTEDTKLKFSVPVTSLIVLDGSLNEDDRAKVKEHMLEEDVLNVDEHAYISFKSTSVTIISEEIWNITGTLSVAGQSANISFETSVSTTKHDTIKATGKTELKLADFGIKPVSALGGTIKTGKVITIDFSVTAQSGQPL